MHWRCPETARCGSQRTPPALLGKTSQYADGVIIGVCACVLSGESARAQAPFVINVEGCVHRGASWVISFVVTFTLGDTAPDVALVIHWHWPFRSRRSAMCFASRSPVPGRKWETEKPLSSHLSTEAAPVPLLCTAPHMVRTAATLRCLQTHIEADALGVKCQCANLPVAWCRTSNQ